MFLKRSPYLSEIHIEIFADEIISENNTRWEEVDGGRDEIWTWVEVVETGWWEHGRSLYYFGYFGVHLKFSTNKNI